MSHPRLQSSLTGLAGAVVLTLVTAFARTGAQTGNLPNPYHEVAGWAKLPPGVSWGGVISVDPAPNGDIWVFHRSDPTILRFDQSGKVVKSFGAGLFVQAHGMTVDRDGNVWVTDAQSKDGKGQQVFKFSPEGKVLLTLGKAGIAGDGNDVFSGPADVVVARNGDIFVADGHIAARHRPHVKFSKMAGSSGWGGKTGEFDTRMRWRSTPRRIVATREHRINLRSDGRFIVRKQFAVRRRVHRRERHDLRRRFAIERHTESWIQEGYPDRQRQGRHGDGHGAVCRIRSGQEQQRRLGRRCRRREGQPVRGGGHHRDAQEILEVTATTSGA